MLRNLVEFINKNYNVPSNVKFIVNDSEIKYGKKYKESRTTLESLKYFSEKQRQYVYISGSIENIIQRLKGYWQETLKLLFSVNSIVFDIFSAELIGVN